MSRATDFGFPSPLVNDSSEKLLYPDPTPRPAPVGGAPCEQGDAGGNDFPIDVGGGDAGGSDSPMDDFGGENSSGVDERDGLNDGGSSSGAGGSAGGTAGGGACGGASAQGVGITGRVMEGDGAYVVPAAACSTHQSVAPTFGTGMCHGGRPIAPREPEGPGPEGY